MSGSNTKSPPFSPLSAYLTLAQAILALQREVRAIRQELALMPHRSGPRCRPINWRGLADALTALREVLSTPAAQALCAGALPLIAAVVKWLFG
jgi:hypothetical protein